MADICRAVLDETNLCRANPRSYAQKLERLLGYFRGSTIYAPGSSCGLMTQEGPSAVREAIQVLNRTAAMGALEWRDGLARAAQDHCEDIGATGAFSHDGSDGSSMSDRVARYGEWQTTCGENISFGSSTAEDIVMQLIIDDGVPSRGHRNNILNRAFGTSGVGFAKHKAMRQVCTIDYSGGYIDHGGARPTSQSVRPAYATPASRVREPVQQTPSVRPGRPSIIDDFDDDFASDMPQMPAGAVSMSTRISTMTKNGRTVKKTTTTYTFGDGSTQVSEETQVT
jgi:uncharacterized protein YkwD